MEGWAVSRMAMRVAVTLCCFGYFAISSTHSYRHTANATVTSTDFLTIGSTRSRSGRKNIYNNSSTSGHSNIYNSSTTGHSDSYNSSTNDHSNIYNNSNTTGHSNIYNNNSTSGHSNIYNNSSTTGHSNIYNNSSTIGHSNNNINHYSNSNSKISGHNNSSKSGHITTDHSNISSTSYHNSNSSTADLITNSSTSGHINRNTTDHNNITSTIYHNTDSSTADLITNSSTRDHSNTHSSTTDHANNSSTTDHANNSSTTDHANNSSTTDHANNSSTTDHANNSSTTDQSNLGSTNGHSNTHSSTTDYANNSSTTDHTNNSSTTDQSNLGSTNGHSNTHSSNRNILTITEDKNNISKELSFLEMDSLCPGAADYLSNQTERNVLRVRVRDCWNTSRDSRAQHGVVYGLCNDSTSFCQFLVQVPHGMVVRASVRPLKSQCPWRTDFYVDWTQSFVSFVPDVSVDCHNPIRSSMFLSRTNQLFVSHHNRPMLQIHFQAVKPTIETVYTSHHQGHMTLILQEGLLLKNEIWSRLQVPEAHVVMISFERLHGELLECQRYVELRCKERNKTRGTVSRFSDDVDRTANVYYTAHLEIRFGFISIPSFSNMLCVKMLFSFHSVSRVPQSLASGLFNCSVDDYWSFRQHLDCNTKFQCEDGRDETAHCPFSSPACNGLVASDHKCYMYVKLQSRLTPRGAENECRARGMELASIRSKKELDDFQKLFEYRGVSKVLTGLTIQPHSVSFMYSQILTWSSTTVTYNIHLRTFYIRYITSRDIEYYAFDSDMRRAPEMRKTERLVHHLVCEKYLRYSPSESVEYVADSLINFTHTNQNLLACPDGHVTHEFLSCDRKSECGQTPCVFFTQKRNITEVDPAVHPPFQTVAVFTCSKNGMVLSYTLVCDFREDCQDRSDESFCQHPPCEDFTCANGQCVPLDKRCNDEVDCLDDSDEMHCHLLHEKYYVIQGEQQPPLLINLDGKGWFSQRVMNTTESCPGTHYRCPTAWLYCLPVYTRCNGLNDCINHEDERDCEKRTCPGLYLCRDSAVCVHASHLCDGWPQCPQRDDEWLCDVTCPAGCLCQGHAFLCPRPFSAHLFPQLRSLDASHSGMTPLDLMNNTYIVHLNLARCSIRFLPDMVFPNIQIINLSYNKLTSILMNAFVGLGNLQLLTLKDNLLISLSSNSSSLQQHALTTIDLSGTHLGVFDSQTLSHFRDVQYVNLSFSAVHSIGSGGFQNVAHLKELDMRGNLITEFPIGMFVGLNDLTHVFSSNYRLCCQDVLPKHFPITNCVAPQPYISSCEQLLFGIYRLTFWFVGILATLGNVACSTVHLVVKKPFRATVALFVANLQCANFCTGVYAIVIAAAHETFRGQYLHHEDKWTNSLPCKMAGFLSLLSSEVSVLIIWLLSLDQVVFLCFPSTSYRFNKRSAALACGVTWVVGILLASTPLLPGLSPCWRYGQTAVCGLMLRDRHCSTQNNNFILATAIVNFLLCLMVFAGQLIVLKTLPKHRILLDSSKRTAYSSADLFMKVAVTDAVSWFIITVTMVMTLTGVGGSEMVDVVMAVVMLPLNSALNPLLCLWHAATDRRRQEREERLLRVLKSRLTSVSNRAVK